MAKFDHGGDCPCGLQSECDCEDNGRYPHLRPTESNSREREEINDTAKDLRELGGRIKSLSYRGMMQLCELMQNASGEGKALPDVFLETADTLSKVSR